MQYETEPVSDDNVPNGYFNPDNSQLKLNKDNVEANAQNRFRLSMRAMVRLERLSSAEQFEDEWFAHRLAGVERLRGYFNDGDCAVIDSACSYRAILPESMLAVDVFF